MQPSGLSLSMDGRELWVADSESSTVRSMDLTTGGSRVSCLLFGKQNHLNYPQEKHTYVLLWWVKEGASASLFVLHQWDGGLRVLYRIVGQ